MKPTPLFDMDGTLIDSAVGITRCVAHALTQMNVAVPPQSELRRWIGSSLRTSFGPLFELIAEALVRLQLAPSQCWMIGDRHMDIEGARHHDMCNIGVLWGFGGEAELRVAGAQLLAAEPKQLPGLLAA